MTRIFIPTDFSVHADRAMEYAFRNYGQATDVDFIVAHFFSVQQDPGFLISIDDLIRKDYEQTTITQVQRVMHELEEPLGQITVIVRPGPLKQNMLPIAGDLGATMIIFSQSLPALKRLPPSMIKKSPIPILPIIT